MCTRGFASLLYFITKAFLFTRKQNQSLIKILHHGDAIETACIRVHFQTIKYAMPILYILRICRWWQIPFMILNLRRDMATAALHFSLRMTST